MEEKYMTLDDIIKKNEKNGIKYRRGRRFFLKRFKGRNSQFEGKRDLRRRIKVENLNKDIQNAELTKLFAPYGTLIRCGIHYDKLGVSRGVADIEYSSHDEAEKAINKLDNADINGVKVSVKYAANRFNSFRRSRTNIRRKYIRLNRRNQKAGERTRFRRFRRRTGNRTGTSRRTTGGRRRIVFRRTLGRRRRRQQN